MQFMNAPGTPGSRPNLSMFKKSFLMKPTSSGAPPLVRHSGFPIPQTHPSVKRGLGAPRPLRGRIAVSMRVKEMPSAEERMSIRIPRVESIRSKIPQRKETLKEMVSPPSSRTPSKSSEEERETSGENEPSREMTLKRSDSNLKARRTTSRLLPRLRTAPSLEEQEATKKIKMILQMRESDVRWPRAAPPYFSLADKVDHLPLSHLLSPPFPAHLPGVCESVGPPIVVCLSHRFVDLTPSLPMPKANARGDDVMSPSEKLCQTKKQGSDTTLKTAPSSERSPSSRERHRSPSSREKGRPSPGLEQRSSSLKENKQSSKELSRGKSGRSKESLRLLRSKSSLQSKPSFHQSSSSIIEAASSQYTPEEESIDPLYVSPSALSSSARQVFGELPPNPLAILMAAWTTMMEGKGEQVITLFGNVDILSISGDRSPILSLLLNAIFLGGLPEDTRESQIDSITASCLLLNSFSHFGLSCSFGASSGRALTKWQINFDPLGTATGIRLSTRLIDTMITPEIGIFHSIEIVLQMLYSKSKACESYCLLGYEKKAIELEYMKSLKIYCLPLWNLIGIRLSNEQAFRWIRSFGTLGLSKQQIRCIVLNILAIAILIAPVSEDVGPIAKGDILSLLLSVPKTFIEETLELAALSYDYHLQTSSSEKGDMLAKVCYFFGSYLHRQLYAWLACIVEDRLKILVPQATSINEATNLFGKPNVIHIIDGPTNINPNTNRTIGTLACLVTQSAVEAYTFLRVNQVRSLIRMQGISLEGTSITDFEFGLDENPNSDDVVASFLLQGGLFSFGLLGQRTPQEFHEWLIFMSTPQNEDEDTRRDVINYCATKVFLHTEDRKAIAFRFNDAPASYQWSLQTLAESTLPHAEMQSFFRSSLAKGSLHRLLKWQPAMESSRTTFNEFDRLLNAVTDIIQPVLHVAPFAVLRGATIEDLTRLDRCPKPLRAITKWQQEGFGVWLPLDAFSQQFEILIHKFQDEGVVNVEDLLFSMAAKKTFHKAYKSRKVCDNAFRCGLTGVLLKSEFYRALHFYQNQIREQTSPKLSREIVEVAEDVGEQKKKRRHRRKKKQKLGKQTLDELQSFVHSPQEIAREIHFGDPWRRISMLPSITVRGPDDQAFVSGVAKPDGTPSLPISLNGQGTQISREKLEELFQTTWQKVGEEGAWKGVIYCTKEAADEIERLRILEHEIGSRPAAKDVEETMTNFLAGFCEPFLGSGTAKALLVCRGDEDFHAAAKEAHKAHFERPPQLEPCSEIQGTGSLDSQVVEQIELIE